MKFDMHIHTDASVDSGASLERMIRAARAAGLDGFAPANHNVFVPPPPPQADFLVIPACEYSTDAGHMLVYFLTAPLDTGLIRDAQGRFPWRDILSRAHAQGALVFLAHPFAPAVDRPPDLWEALDGVEAYNARIVHSRVPSPNQRALELCARLRVPCSAGSDAHFPAEVGAAYWECALRAETPEARLAELKERLRAGEGALWGGAARPLWRAASQWLKLKRNRAWRDVWALLPRTARAVLKSILPRRSPRRIGEIDHRKG